MPVSQPEQSSKANAPILTPTKVVNKAAIAKAFDNKNPSVKERVRQWQEQGGGVKAPPPSVNAASNVEQGSSFAQSRDTVDNNEVTKSTNQRSLKQVAGSEVEVLQEAIEVCQNDCDVSFKPALPEIAAKKRQSVKKKPQPTTKLRIAQAIVGPTVRPSQRLRRLSEIQRDAKTTESPTEGKQVVELKEDEVQEQSNTKEVASPKKRIVSDSRWRQKERFSNNSFDLAHTSDDKAPFVEGWLKSVGSNAIRCSTPVKEKEKTLVIDKLDSETIQEVVSDEAERKRRLNINTVNTPKLEGHEPVEQKSVDQNPSNYNWLSPNAQSFVGKDRPKPKNEVIASKDSQTPMKIPTSSRLASQPMEASSENLESIETNVGNDLTEASDSEESDHLTSISRRPRPKHFPERTKRNIFSHATKLLFRSDSRPEFSELDTAGTARLPTVQSWLDHTPDPFTNDDSCFSPGQEDQSSSAKDHDLLPGHNGEWAHSLPQASNIGENAAITKQYGGPESSQNDSINSPGRKRRVKRVLRHRDGSITIGDGSEPYAAPQNVDDTPGSDYETKRLSVLGRASLASDEHPKSHIAIAGKSSPRKESQQPIVKLSTRQGVVATNELTELLSSRKSSQSACGFEKTEVSKGLTRHSDLISILSMPTEKGSIIPSARNLRAQTSRLKNTTIEGILEQFAVDEAKYAQELYTLVEGVIPVILSEILASSDAQATTHFSSFGINDNSQKLVTQEILDMGLMLERLQAQHERGIFRKHKELLTWVSATLPYYQNYLRVWRLGFQDVMVNLAVRESFGNMHQAERDGLRQKASQDGFDHEDRVDVTFLLKRPLIRVKNITKTVKRIAQLDSSEENTTLIYQCERLVEEARTKSNEERARIEDESAARIDATRARDPRTLSLVGGAAISLHRRVKARDTFDLKFLHSSGQRLDCKVEIHLRDDPSDLRSGSDVLISQVDGTGHFLLFPPLSKRNMSARNGGMACEIIIMIREDGVDQFVWYELLSLTADEEDIVSEWIVLLGASPIPPSNRQSYSDVIQDDRQVFRMNDNTLTRTLPSTGWQAEAPIGERSSASTSSSPKVWQPFPQRKSFHQNPSTILEETPSALAAEADSQSLTTVAATSKTDHGHQRTQTRAKTVRQMTPRKPLIGDQQHHASDSTLRRSGAQRRFTMSLDESLRTTTSESNTIERPRGSYSSPDSDIRSYGNATMSELNDPTKSTQLHKSRPMRYHSPKRHSSGQTATKDSIDKSKTIPMRTVHSAELPAVSTISNLERHLEIASTSTKEELENPTLIASERKALPQDRRSKMDSNLPIGAENLPRRLHRRMSSPLKHEYAPSNISDSESDPESSMSRQDGSSRSDSSDSEHEEDAPSVLVPMFAVRRYRKTPRTTPPESLADNTLSPSQSASQAPYRSVPVHSGKGFRAIAMISTWSSKGFWESLWPRDCLVVISPGLIEAYELSGNNNDSKSTSNEALWLNKSLKPLIGLELTPLVPIRRGTALDISIRSPPTSDSMITTTSSHNFLFRSPSAEQCELLYFNINHSRINNPTYIALQNARATSFTPHFQGFQQSSKTGDGGSLSWFGLGRRRKSYRAAGVSAPSVSRNTESSVSSLASAFSALRNFGRVGSRFNIAKSTISSRHGSRSEDEYMASDDFSQGDVAANFNPIARVNDGTLGLNNCRIRLYLRESTTKWSDLGSARLAILRPRTKLGTSTTKPYDGSDPSVGTVSTQTQEGIMSDSKGDSTPAASLKELTSPGNKASSDDKRILITTSSQNVLSVNEKPRTLLDVTLGETCFERVARTGIAISVWENFEGGMVAKQGGVVGGKLRVYMMQFKNEADTAYTYSIVGKLRY